MSMRLRWLLVAGLAAGAVALWAADVQVRRAPVTMQPMVSDLRVALLGPRSHARTEVALVRAQGRVEGTGPVPGVARVEMGFRRGEQYLVSKTISVPVGASFSELVSMPEDGSATFYVAVVKYSHLVYSDDVGVRPREGRDLSSGSRACARIRLADDRGRRLDGRVVVRQGATLVGERYTVGGNAELYDLAPGEYQVTATSSGDLITPLPLTIRLRSGETPVCVLGLAPRP